MEHPQQHRRLLMHSQDRHDDVHVTILVAYLLQLPGAHLPAICRVIGGGLSIYPVDELGGGLSMYPVDECLQRVRALACT